MFEFLNITKALGDQNRLRALMALEGRELCACQIIELLELAPSTVSKHMAVLKQARLVTARKSGRWMYYRLAEASAPAKITSALSWVKESLAGSDLIAEDKKRLKKIMKIDRDVLCNRKPRSADSKTTRTANV